MKTLFRNIKELPDMMRAVYVFLLAGGILSCLMPWLLEKYPPNDPDYIEPTRTEIYEMLFYGVSALIVWFSIHKRIKSSRLIIVFLLIGHCLYQLPLVLCGSVKVDALVIAITLGMVAWICFYLFKNLKIKAYYERRD